MVEIVFILKPYTAFCFVLFCFVAVFLVKYLCSEKYNGLINSNNDINISQH